MKKQINWWVPILKGLVFFGLGIYIVNQPDESMEAFITSVGLILILIGITLSALAYYTRKKWVNFKSYLVLGIVQIGLGIFMLMNQEAARRIFEIAMGLVVGFSGVVNLIIATNIRKAKCALLALDSTCKHFRAPYCLHIHFLPRYWRLNSHDSIRRWYGRFRYV